MRSSLSLAFCLFLASAAQAQELNVLTSVEVRSEGNTVLVSVKGSKPPNFTTFSMADPARFVIDFSEAKFQGVPEDMRIEDGVIRVIKNLAYGSGATAIARVMLAFSVDVDPPDVQISGTTLLVRMNKPGGAAVAATGSQPAGAASPAAAATASAGATGAAGSAAAVATDAGAAAAQASAAAAAASARSEAEAVRQETLAREQREVEAREQARLAAETSAKEREAQARAETEARAREAEKAAAEQVAAEAAALAAADARRAEIKARAAAEELQAQSPAAAAVAQPQSADAERAARVQAEADARARREVEAALAAQQPAAAAPSRAPAPVLARPEVPARAARLQAVGFKQLPTVSRVFVQTSVTPRFTITDVGDDVVRLEVENTRASRRNDTRPLDTSFFPTAVALISPSRVGTSYVVDIKLKKRVPYQQKVEGDVLAIDFERPPALGEGGATGGMERTTGPAVGATSQAELENQQGLVVDPDDKVDAAGSAGDKEPAAEPKQ